MNNFLINTKKKKGIKVFRYSSTIIMVLMLLIITPIHAQKVINLKSLGIEHVEDATPIVYHALQSVNNKNVKIIFPKGTYNFYPDKAMGKYHTVTNHDNSYKYFAIPLIDAENIEIDGQGSEFIFHGMIVPILVEQSKNIKLKNFSVDWAEPFFLQGAVTAVNKEENTFDLKVSDEVSSQIKDGRLTFTANGQEHDYLGQNMVFDPKTKAVVYKATDYLLGPRKLAKAEKIGTNHYRLIKPAVKSLPPVGVLYVFKGSSGENRLAPAIHLVRSSGIDLSHINIYHAGGMGVIGEHTANITLHTFNVKLKEGSDRIVSASADATHFCNCGGKLLIEDCLFENMLDDATNVHGTYMKVAELISLKVLSARLMHYEQTDYDFGIKNDSIQFVDYETLLPLATNMIQSVKKINERYYEFTFKDPIASHVKVGDGIENISWYPDFVFRNNVVRNNRARSILVSNRKSSLVEGNSFSSMMTSILVEGDMISWHESGAVNNFVIRNNQFGDNVYGGGKGSVIWINPRMKKQIPQTPYEHNIVIENNTFHTFDKSILNAGSVDCLTFRNNTINRSNTYLPLYAEMPTICVKNSQHVIIDNNTYGKNVDPQIYLDERTQKSSSLDKTALKFLNQY